MASPVNTDVKHFHSGMSGAPVLNGVAGSALDVIAACIETGFDVKAATSLSVSGGIATLSFAGSHSAAVETVILVTGVSGALAALNGEQRITALGVGQVKFATAAADGTAAGSITFKMAPAGWLKAFSGPNISGYQSADVQSTKMFVRIDDTGTTSFRLRGYESMSDVNTGAGMFPLDSQISGGGWCNKSANENTNPVKWKMVADSRGMFINIVGYSGSNPNCESGRTIYIGDFTSSRPGGDPYAFLLGCGTGYNYNGITGTCDQDSQPYHFAPRAYHGLGSSVGHSSIPETGANYTSGMDSFFGPFPSKIDGSLRLSRRFITEGNSSEPRGILPGLYTIPQSNVGTVIAPGSIITGTGSLTGRKLLAIGCGSSSYGFPNASLGISMIDITGPWAR